MRPVPLLHALAAVALVTALALSSDAQQTKSAKLPPALDPGGVAVALLSTGIDYLQPDIAARLARDGEGEPIAWDFVDDDNRPYLSTPNETPAISGGDGTALARVLTGVAEVPTRIIPVRVNPNDPSAVAKAVAFVARTPATIVIVPMWSASAGDWELFRQAAEKSSQLLFIVAAGDGDADLDKTPVFPAALGIDNVLVVTAVSFGDRDWRFRGNWGRATVDAVVPVALRADEPPVSPPLTGRAAALAAVAAAQTVALDGPLPGRKLKEKVLATALWQTAETPARTKTQAVILPVITRPDELAPGYPGGLRQRKP